MTHQEKVATLLGKDGSRCNKMHLAAGWGFMWRWKGEGPTANGTMRSRMEFLIDGKWITAKSWDEDVRPKLKDGLGKQKQAEL